MFRPHVKIPVGSYVDVPDDTGSPDVRHRKDQEGKGGRGRCFLVTYLAAAVGGERDHPTGRLFRRYNPVLC